MQKVAEELNERLKEKTAQEIVDFFVEHYPDEVTLGSSMGAEDQVLTDMMVKTGGKFSIFTLDTGRLFPETYDVIDATNEKYNIQIQVFFPDAQQVQEMVNKKGVNLFYKSIENRKECCHIRKVEPSKKALEGKKVWINGLRKDQSLARFFTKLVEWDESNQLLKINPLLNWREKDVWEYIRTNDIPYNKLHDQGFPSIGCQPCTRAIKPGEDFRAGRWWWEEADQNECGLHVKEEEKKGG